jgi:Ran GTPase-activating protein (RanGAP) involved in mRNA processing and transport
MNDRWTQLRTLLSCQPHHRVWGALVRRLDDWPAEELEAALTEAEAALRTWPDELRYGDLWLPALLAGQPQPRFRLARHLYLSNPAPEQLARVLELPELATLPSLSLTASGPGTDELLRIVARSPTLRKLRSLQLGALPLGQGGLELLLESGALAAAQELKLSGCGLEGGHIQKLVEALPSGGPRSLELSQNPIGDVGARAIAAWQGAQGLRRLVLDTCQVGVEGAAALGASTHLSQLEELSAWQQTGWGTAGIAAFLQDFRLTRLRALRLWAHGLGDEGAQALAACPGLARLEVLNLLENGIGPKGCQALARSPHLENLRELSLNRNPLGIKGLTALAESPLLGRLHTLHLNVTKAGPKGTAALAASPQAAGLRHLELNANDLKNEGVTALVRSPHLAGLRCLKLSNNKIGPDGAAVLAGAEWRELSELDLSGNPLGGAGGAALGQGNGLSTVAVLNLSHCRLGNAGVAALVRASRWNQLERLNLESNSLRRAGLEALVQAAGNVPRLAVLEAAGNQLTSDEQAVLLQSRSLTAAAITGGHYVLQELAVSKPETIPLSEAQAFFEEFLRREHAVHVAKYLKTPEGLEETQKEFRALCGLGYFEHVAHQGRAGREVCERQASWQTTRTLFLIRAYKHPALGTLFRGYVGPDSTYGHPPVAQQYDQSYFVALAGGSLKCIARYRLCLDCHGVGRLNGRPCSECKRYGRKWKGPWNGWEHAGGQELQELGTPVGVLRLKPPSDPAHREEYDA